MDANRRSLEACLLACLALPGLVISLLQPHAARAASQGIGGGAEPVLLVHGYAVVSARGHDCSEYWAPAIGAIEQALPGKLDLLGVGYYLSDKNCPAVIDDSATNDTPIENLGNRLAWYVYDHYSSRDRSVDLVGHAMGGLIIRHALGRVAAGDPAFPPALLVKDAVTISTGHAGDLQASRCPWSYQCRELVPGSPFLAQLDPNPQGAGGTSWTVLASYCDVAVAPESAAAMKAAHRFLYRSPCYGHVSSIQDTSTARDATYDHSENLGVWATEGGRPHSLQLLAMALDGALNTRPPAQQEQPSPEAQAEPPPASARCTVPRLRGRSVRRARALLAKAGCRLGRVFRRRLAGSTLRRYRRRGYALRIVWQSAVAGATIDDGSPIHVKVGWRLAKRRSVHRRTPRPRAQAGATRPGSGL